MIPKAVIAPHAGYVYSGRVAAAAFATLRGRAQAIERVVLVGPAHYLPMRGIAAPTVEQKSDLPVIFLTSKEEEMDERFGLKMGADDFIRKPFSHRLLVERVKVVLRRTTPKDGAPAKDASSNVLERGELCMDPERHTCTWKNASVTLTVTEFLISQALASRPGVVKSRNALMDAAYDEDVYVDDRTIGSHIKRLRRKFKVHRVRHLQIAMQLLHGAAGFVVHLAKSCCALASQKRVASPFARPNSLPGLATLTKALQGPEVARPSDDLSHELS